jgi:hypothetical protein
MRPSSWNGVGAIAKVPAAWAVSLVMRASWFVVRDGPKDQSRNIRIPGGAIASPRFAFRDPE